jgi:CheY-like chemotaxis protein
MVIDDDEISLSLISLLLKSEGYDVIEASGGASALGALASVSAGSRPAAVLADLHMPGLFGSALAAELRRVAPEAKLLAMSATPDAAEGYDGFLKKPLDPAALRALLNGSVSATDPPKAAMEDPPVLDEAVFQKMFRLMSPAAVRETYEACIKDAYSREQEMRAAAAKNDLPAVRSIAHTLKGSAGMVGAAKLASSAVELELGVYQPKQVFRLIDNLLSCCHELHRILLAKL